MRSYLIETRDPGLVIAAKHDQYWNPANEDIDVRYLLCFPLAFVIQRVHEWYVSLYHDGYIPDTS